MTTSTDLEDVVNNNAYTPRYPPSPNRGSAVLLVTLAEETAKALVNSLFMEGYAVKPVRTAQEAATAVKDSYLEAVILDVEGLTPQAGEYRESDALVLLKETNKMNPDLPVLLVTSGKGYPQPPPSILDLINAGAIGTEDRQPFDAAAFGNGPKTGLQQPYRAFFETLRQKVEDVKTKQKDRLRVVSEELPEIPKGENMPLRIGEAVKAIYQRDRHGGAGHFLRDSISGVAVTIDPAKLYPEDAKTIHIKSVTPEEARGFMGTYEFLKSKNPSRKTPAPLAFYSEGDRAHLVSEFLIASNFSDISAALNPRNPQVRESDREVAVKLWDEVLTHFFAKEFPRWYADTHERIMADDHKAARDATIQKQIEQTLLFSRHIPDISGKPAPQGLYEKMTNAVLTINRRPAGIDPRLFVLPMDPKGANIGHMTYQSIPPPQRLFDLFTTPPPQGSQEDRQVNAGKFDDTFTSWDHKMLGTANPFLVDLWQAILDPTHNIPEEKMPVRLEQSLQAIFSDTDLNEFIIEAWKQGIYKSALKSFVSVAHAQVNEGRLARMKNLNYDDVVGYRRRLQSDVDHFLTQTLKFASGTYTAINEGHANLSWPQPLERMVEHFRDPERWKRLENGTTSRRPELLALRTLHEGFSLIINEGWGQFNPDHIRRNYERGRILTY